MGVEASYWMVTRRTHMAMNSKKYNHETGGVTESKRGLGGYFLYSFTLLLLGVSFHLGIKGMAQKPTLEDLGLILVPIPFCVYCLTAISARYTIDRDGILSKTIWRKRKIFWKEISQIKLIPTYFGRFSVQLVNKQNNEHFPLFVAVMTNSKLFTLALAEAAHHANPNIKFDRIFTGIYGLPPYGIFSDGKVTTKNV